MSLQSGTGQVFMGSGRRRARALCAFVASIGVAAACATSPLGRSQLMLYSEQEMDAMGLAAYDKLKQEVPKSTDPVATRYVACVARAVTDALPQDQSSVSWEVTLFEEPTANAFALPGGKMGVHTGLLKIAKNQDQLATVLGHEVAHVLAHHSNERVSTQSLVGAGQQAVQVLAGGTSPGQQQLLGALGVQVAQYGLILPYGRAQESEADKLGLDLMARAGFDPRESVALWRNMAQAGGAQPPEFASTHPSHQTRIRDLDERTPSAIQLMEGARARGKRPDC
jgi:predicted Zn-dependent protease